jgi:hypothetical protein
VVQFLRLDFLRQHLVVVNHLGRYRRGRRILLRLVEGGYLCQRLIELSLVDLALIDELLAERSQQPGRIPRILPMDLGGRAELLHQVAKVHSDQHVEDLRGQLVKVIDALVVVGSLLAATLKHLMSAPYFTYEVRVYIDYMR